MSISGHSSDTETHSKREDGDRLEVLASQLESEGFTPTYQSGEGNSKHPHIEITCSTKDLQAILDELTTNNKFRVITPEHTPSLKTTHQKTECKNSQGDNNQIIITNSSVGMQFPPAEKHKRRSLSL